jgi:hypothetical protein
LVGAVKEDCIIVSPEGYPILPNNRNWQQFYDFSFDGGTLTVTLLARFRQLGSLNWTTEQRQDHERELARGVGDKTVERIWWERDYICIRCQVPRAESEENRRIAWMAADIVVILLQDRTANKIEVQPNTRPKLSLKFLQRRPQAPYDESAHEIYLTIPRRVYKGTSGKGGGPHAHKRMHYRAEHVRQQPYGPRSAPSYREIVIAGTWINASDIPPAERGTPIARNYRVKAIRAKTNQGASSCLHGR